MDKKEKFFGINETNWGHKWGFKDSGFIINSDKSVIFSGNRYDLCGKRLPSLIPFIEEMLEIEFKTQPIITEIKKKEVDAQTVNQAFMDDIKTCFEKDHYTSEDNERLLHSHGQTSSDEVYKVLYSKLKKFSDLVFYVETEDNVIKLIELAKKHNVCLVPYGGGTSVSNALKLPESEERMIVSVDTRRMKTIEFLDKENLLVTAQAGITGLMLEKELNKKGFTVGHEPDSIEFSTLGGWISTNAAGMKKNKYGNIEDIVQNVTMITPSGIISQKKPLTRSSIGIKPQNLLFGSEGNIGIITKATLKIHALPEISTFESIVFHDWDTGLKFMEELVHTTSSLPASTRLMDNLQLKLGNTLKEEKGGVDKFIDQAKKYILFNLKGFDPEKIVGGVFKIEGTKSEASYQRKLLVALAKKHNGVLAGGSQGKSGYNVTAVVAYIRELIFTQNIIGETLETAVPWSNINQVRNAVIAEVVRLHKENGLPGKPFFCSRISKIYHSGVCMYNTMAMSFKKVENPEIVFSRIEHQLRAVIIDNGGSISHHHGVGKSRKDYMGKTLSNGSISVLKDIKNSQDPKNIFGIRNNVFNK